MYTRQPGDDLCKKDSRLKYNWEWSRIASMYTLEQTKDWTHFQVSKCEMGKWTLEATQWGSGDNVYYTAKVNYKHREVIRDGGDSEKIKTRLDAQIVAENLLTTWIKEEYKVIKSNKYLKS